MFGFDCVAVHRARYVQLRLRKNFGQLLLLLRCFKDRSVGVLLHLLLRSHEFFLNVFHFPDHIRIRLLSGGELFLHFYAHLLHRHPDYQLELLTDRHEFLDRLLLLRRDAKFFHNVRQRHAADQVRRDDGHPVRGYHPRLGADILTQVSLFGVVQRTTRLEERQEPRQ